MVCGTLFPTLPFRALPITGFSVWVRPIQRSVQAFKFAIDFLKCYRSFALSVCIWGYLIPFFICSPILSFPDSYLAFPWAVKPVLKCSTENDTFRHPLAVLSLVLSGNEYQQLALNTTSPYRSLVFNHQRYLLPVCTTIPFEATAVALWWQIQFQLIYNSNAISWPHTSRKVATTYHLSAA